MVKTLKDKTDSIVNGHIEPHLTYSIFKQWLSQDESESEIMSISDVNSFGDYRRIKEIEFQFLKMLVELNTNLNLQVIDMDTLECIGGLDFNFILKKVSNYITQDKEVLFFIPKEEIFIVLSRDFNIYIYSDKEVTIVEDVLKKHHFYCLP